MNEILYSLAGLIIKIKSDHQIEIAREFFPFLISEGIHNCVVTYKKDILITEDSDELLFSNDEYSVFLKNNDYIRYYYDKRKKGSPYAMCECNWKEKSLLVSYTMDGLKFLSESSNALFHIGLEQILLREQRLIFHAACVETNYGGILFTGPSGAGKSTQADLWVMHRNAFLINGDRPILSKDETVWKAWGSPYAGSSKCYVNKSCNICAIVRVVQDSSNMIKRLKGSKAFITVFSGVTVNDWSREDVNMASSLVIELINSISVYEFRCTKTEEAVEMLEEVLKGEKTI